jgi:hypothetical protein
MKAFIHIAAVGITLALAASPVGAQSLTTETTEDVATPSISVTPFVSIGSSASSRVGAAVTFPWKRNFSLEAEIGYRRAEINALSAHLNLLYDLPAVGRVTPYLATGLGLEQYGTAETLPAGGFATQARTAVFVNAGGGIKVPVDNNWGLRTDARWFNGIGRDAGEHWRVYNGVTWLTGRR